MQTTLFYTAKSQHQAKANPYGQKAPQLPAPKHANDDTTTKCLKLKDLVKV